MEAPNALTPVSGSPTSVTAAASHRPAAPTSVPPPLETPKSQPVGLPEKSPLLAAWPRSALITTTVLLITVAALLVWHYFSATASGTRPAYLEHRVNLNRAPVAELEQIPNIGPKRAAKIDAYRRLHGPFRSVEDLRKVPGFGAVTVEQLRDHVKAHSDEREPDRTEPPLPTFKAPKKTVKLSKKEAALQGVVIDINRASLQELQRLPRIGPKMAQRIVDERNRARFKTVADLRRVAGIGPKTLERLRPYVTVGEPTQGVEAEAD